MLLQEKQLSLRDRIGDFYSCRMSESVKSITIQNLLTHTSGLSESTFLKQYGSDKKGIIVKLLGIRMPGHVDTTFVSDARSKMVSIFISISAGISC